ncbi:MAG: hypothetical protein COB66_03680 [Coxiella sp. (in: Bacteria)]|nr:MAG: hypothetical protein COB66_03680 [Coxiella sp. (in: g-proteobacteria)]
MLPQLNGDLSGSELNAIVGDFRGLFPVLLRATEINLPDDVLDSFNLLGAYVQLEMEDEPVFHGQTFTEFFASPSTSDLFGRLPFLARRL